MGFIDEHYSEAKDYARIREAFHDVGANASTLNYITELGLDDEEGWGDFCLDRRA